MGKIPGAPERITDLSDWHISNSKLTVFVSPKSTVDGYANYEYEVQNNVYGRDFDNATVVMYASESTSASDGEGNLYITEAYAYLDGILKEG